MRTKQKTPERNYSFQFPGEMSLAGGRMTSATNICNEILLSHKNEQNNVSQHCNESESVGSSVVSDSLQPYGL